MAFKEDAVREELVAPILRRAGYRPSGKLRVERSKALLHPFVMIGSKRHRVSIVPDYALYEADHVLLILDAKSPTEEVVRSHHVEQAYSYAIHPEVRCQNYSLCNGRLFALFHVHRTEPVFVVPVPELDRRWTEFSEYLDPNYLKMPEIRDFAPDFGLHAHNAGIREGAEFVFADFNIQNLAKMTDDLWTVSSMGLTDGEEQLLSFDFNTPTLQGILGPLPQESASRVRAALARSPFQVDLAGQVIISCRSRLGPITKGQYEPFAPFIITELLSSRYDPNVVLLNDFSNTARSDTPDWVFRLTRR
jgi:hypothetical protein